MRIYADDVCFPVAQGKSIGMGKILEPTASNLINILIKVLHMCRY